MKNIYLNILLVVTLGLTAISCDKDLPFPIDEVKRGVVIDVSKVAGSTKILSEGELQGEYKVELLIPSQQGDYSMMKYAQLVAVFKGVDGKISSQIIKDEITDFPTIISFNLEDVYSKFGKTTAPELGETLTFTVNVLLNDGLFIPGWDAITGAYNNSAFTTWMVGRRNLSNKAEYRVVCPFDPATTFIGTFQCIETSDYGSDGYPVTLSHYAEAPAAEFIPEGVDASQLFGIEIEPISPNIWKTVHKSTIVWFNTTDHELVTPNQPTGGLYQGSLSIDWVFTNAIASVCDKTLIFSATPTIIGVGAYRPIKFSIKP